MNFKIKLKLLFVQIVFMKVKGLSPGSKGIAMSYHLVVTPLVKFPV